MTAVVRTVLGDIDPTTLGVTYLHEHLIIDTPLVADRWPHIYLPSADEATAEASFCVAAGVQAMVDVMPAAAGRHPSRLAEASRRAAVHVVAATGLHTEKYYDGMEWTVAESPTALAGLFTADITTGIDRYDYTGPLVQRTEHRAGILKVATSADQPTDRDRLLFEAAAISHAATGAPIITHCEEGRGAPEQVDLLSSLEVPLDRVVLSHTDKVTDPGYHRTLLETGVNLEYDQGLRQPAATLRLLTAMIERGFAAQIMLGTDGARRSLWAALGGSPGLATLYGNFARALEPDVRHLLFVTNPARFLAFHPPA